MESLKPNISISASSRKINPGLTVRDVYTYRHGVRDHWISFSHICLSAHWLVVEVGRWNQRCGRELLCPCGMVHTEDYVIKECPFSQHICDQCDLSGLNSSYGGTFDNATVL